MGGGILHPFNINEKVEEEMNTLKYLLIIAAGVVVWYFLTIKLFNFFSKFIAGIPEDKKSNTTLWGLILDIFIIGFGAYAFYTRLLVGLSSELGDRTVNLIVVLLVYLGSLGLFGYWGLGKYFQYGVVILMVWAFISFTIVVAIFERDQFVYMFRQLWDGYNWIIVFLFPMGIGSIIKRVGLYISRNKK